MSWTPDELDAVGDADELHITALRQDGGSAKPVPIWVVRVGDELFVRSWTGERGAWYRHARVTGRARIEAGGVTHDAALVATAAHDAEVDAAFRAKYGASQYAEEMTQEPAHATTMRVDPA